MNFGLNKYYNTVSFNYINDIIETANRNLIEASNKNNIESFNELLDFIQFTLLSKSFNKSIKVYSKVTTGFIYVYQALNPQFKVLFLERIFESLSMKIRINEDYEEADNQYIELSYLALINITKLIFQEDNFQAFNAVYKKIQTSLFKIDFDRDKSGYFFKFITSLLCWIYYLKFNNSITYEKYDLKYFEQNFESLTIDFDKIFINDFFILFDEIEDGLWSINEWEIKEPPVNEVYFALMPNLWLPFSLTILLLKYNHLINANDDLTQIELRPKFKYFFDDIKNILDKISIDNEQYMDTIFNETNTKDLEQLNYKKDKILNVFGLLKKEVEINDYKEISEVPLSENKVNEFRNNVGKLWEENHIIINILNYFQKVNYLPNIEKMDGYGFFQTLLKMRFAFIEGKHYQTIIGLNDFGSRLARNVDNQFFTKLLSNRDLIRSKNISETIDQFISKTKNKQNLIIFANWKAAQKIGNTVHEQHKVLPFAYNSYNNIPIVSYFNAFKDLIFVVDFSNISINIYTSEKPTWYKDQLLVEVTEYQKGIITEDTIKEWNEKDGHIYNKEEVDVLESNNINVKILFKFEYLLNEDSNYLILDIK